MDMVGMYPTWYVPFIGSAWVMGIIGTVHVLFSHTSVGASWLFALLETKAYKENKPELMGYIRRYGMFLLVFSYIWGSVTGPGIWYSTSVASPRGISGLIHNFVWVWATEWVFFTIEVIGVYALVYTIGKIDAKTHLKLTWVFALASWATMLIIVGILSFMMWPGTERWYETASIFDAFYNKNMFAHLLERTALMFNAAAIVGSIIVAGMKEKELRAEVARFIAKMGAVGLVGGGLLLWWYFETLPTNAMLVMQYRLPGNTWAMLLAAGALSMLYLAWIAWKPQWLTVPVAATMTAVLYLVGVWPEERARESMRKPFVAGQYIYSNQVIARDVPGKGVKSEMGLIEAKGILPLNAFLPEGLRTVTEENKMEAGKVLARMMCGNCHALEANALLRPMPKRMFGTRDPRLIEAFLEGPLYHGAIPYMPRIPLPKPEREALALYLAKMAGGPEKQIAGPVPSPAPLGEKETSQNIAASR